jgi:hypothetical protein
MDIKPFLITITLITIFVLEGVFPHYQDRVTRLRHGLPHVLTAIMNDLLTRFALGGLTIGAIAWAQASSFGPVRDHPESVHAVPSQQPGSAGEMGPFCHSRNLLSGNQVFKK